jgi:hypothetical protein
MTLSSKAYTTNIENSYVELEVLPAVTMRSTNFLPPEGFLLGLLCDPEDGSHMFV